MSFRPCADEGAFCFKFVGMSEAGAVIAVEYKRFQTAEEFYGRAESFLTARETENNLILGISTTLVRQPPLSGEPPFFACIEENGRLVGAAVMTPPNNLVLSHIDDMEAIPFLARGVRAGYD